MNDNKVNQQAGSDVNQAQTSFTPSISREQERFATDFLRPAEKPLVLDKEVVETGVEVISEKPVLSDAHTQAGISHSLQNVEPDHKRAEKVEYPLNDNEVEKLLSQQDKKASAYWLSVLITKLKRRIFNK